MSDDEVALRPVCEEDLPFLQGLISDPRDAGSFTWQGFRDPREWRQRWEATRSFVGAGGGVAIVLSGAEPAGFVSWDQNQWFGRPCWSVAIELAREMRGRGVGTRAHELLVSYLFANTLFNRIEAYTEADNLAERRALEKAGFTVEGNLRSVCFREGQWRDGILYSLIRPTT